MTHKNKEDKKKYDRKWFKNNPEKRRRYEKLWREKNSDKVKKQKDRYYKKNKNYIKQKTKEYYFKIQKPYFQQNREEYKRINKIQNNKRLSRRRKLLVELKINKGNKCFKCGYNREPRILLFHHLRDKIKEVSLLQTEKSMKIESEKCILLCPNCHAIEHLTK